MIYHGVNESFLISNFISLLKIEQIASTMLVYSFGTFFSSFIWGRIFDHSNISFLLPLNIIFQFFLFIFLHMLEMKIYLARFFISILYSFINSLTNILIYSLIITNFEKNSTTYIFSIYHLIYYIFYSISMTLSIVLNNLVYQFIIMSILVLCFLCLNILKKA
jgi:predicted MFS family arabinose efflux permease